MAARRSTSPTTSRSLSQRPAWSPGNAPSVAPSMTAPFGGSMAQAPGRSTGPSARAQTRASERPGRERHVLDEPVDRGAIDDPAEGGGAPTGEAAPVVGGVDGAVGARLQGPFERRAVPRDVAELALAVEGEDEALARGVQLAGRTLEGVEADALDGAVDARTCVLRRGCRAGGDRTVLPDVAGAGRLLAGEQQGGAEAQHGERRGSDRRAGAAPPGRPRRANDVVGRRGGPGPRRRRCGAGRPRGRGFGRAGR